MPQVETLLRSIEQSVIDAIADQTAVAVAYSGGLDSSLLAVLAQRTVEMKCYTACAPGSYDARSASSSAAADGLTIETIELTDDDIRRLAAQAASVFGSSDTVRIGYTVPLLSVIHASREGTILVGNLADELFAGYAKYASVDDPAALMRVDLEKALCDIERLVDYAKCEHKVVVAPFASERVVQQAVSTPPSLMIGPQGRKLTLRDVAREIGLSAPERPKKAAQYSSGVSKAMERMAKADGRTLHAWVEALDSA